MRRVAVCVVVAGSIVALQAQGGPVSGPSPMTPPGVAGGPSGPAAPAGQKPAPPPSPAAVARAEQVLAAARAALGGEALAKVRTVVAEGRTRRLRGNNIQPIEFEISIELPDKYLRKDEFPAEESDPVATGFNGDDLIQPPAPPVPARPGGPAPPPAALAAQQAARAASVKQDFARLALGMFAASYPSYPLTFAYVAQAEAPQGKADVLEGRGSGGFVLRLFVNAETHVPIMASWQLPPTSVIVVAAGQPPPPTVAPGAVVVAAPAMPSAAAAQSEKDAYAQQVVALRSKAQATPVEHRLYYADYRDVEGVKFPFRLRRAIGADTTEETTFDRFRINPRIDSRKFAVTK